MPICLIPAEFVDHGQDRSGAPPPYSQAQAQVHLSHVEQREQEQEELQDLERSALHHNYITMHPDNTKSYLLALQCCYTCLKILVTFPYCNGMGWEWVLKCLPRPPRDILDLHDIHQELAGMVEVQGETITTIGRQIAMTYRV